MSTPYGQPANQPNPTTPSQTNSSINVGDIKVAGNMNGNIVVGNNNVINTYHTEHGNVINNYTPPAVKPRDMKPQPPRAPRGFVGREPELKSLEKHIKDKEPILVYGLDGIGKSALIKKAANSETAKAIPDGVLLVEGKDDPASSLRYDDILQQLFDALFESNPPLKAQPTTVRTYLSNTTPLIILDRYDIEVSSLEKLTDMFPKGAIMAASQSSLYSDAFDSIEILPLSRDESVELLSTKSGIENNPANSVLLSQVCELLGDVPLAIIKTANVIREKKIELERVADFLRQIHQPSQDQIRAAIERSYGFIFYSLNQDERKMIAQAAAAPGISVDRSWLEGVSGGKQTSASLEAMELLQANSPRLRVADGYKEVIISSTRNLNALQENFLEYLIDELKSKSLDFDFVSDELGNILGTIQWAASQNRWSNVITLGKAVDPYLTLHGLWDAWEVVLNLVLQAGKSLIDEAIQAWALHQLGSREAGVGNIAPAIKHLIHALRLRESLGDDIGAAYTRHNLNIVFTLKKPPKKSLTEKIVSALKRINPWILIPFILIIGIILVAMFFPIPPKSACPLPEGWQVYRVQEGDTFDSISQKVASTLDIDEKKIPILKITIQNANSDCDLNGTPSTPPTSLPTKLPTEMPINVPGEPATPTVAPISEVTPRSAFINLELSSQPKIVSEVGQNITYTYDIRNLSNGSIPAQFMVENSKSKTIPCPEVNPAGRLNDFLNPDESVICKSNYTVTQADLDRGWILNEAQAGNSESTSNIVTSTVLVTQNPGISISKEADPVVYTQVGQEITYTYTILNSGNVTLSPIQIYVNDVFSNGTEENILCGPDPTELPPGDRVTCTIIYKITQEDIDAGLVSNQASVSIHAYGYNLMATRIPAFIGDTTTTTTVYYALPLTLEKTADREIYDSVDQIITYTYAVTNINNVPLSGPITVDDNKVKVNCPETRPLPPTPTQTPSSTPTQTTTPAFDVTRVPSIFPLIEPTATQPFRTPAPTLPVNDLDKSLEPNETVYCTGTYNITQEDLDFGSVTNEAVAHVGDVESNPVTVIIKADQRRDIELTKSAEPSTFDHVGQVITYIYVVINSGNVTLEGQLTIQDDQLNENTTFDCDFESGILAPRISLTCRANYSITTTDLEARSVTNNAIALFGNISSSASARISCPLPQSDWVVPYTILEGDTLSRISTSYTDLGITVTDLQRKNCKPSTNLRIGEILYVPRSPTGNITGYVFADLDRDNNWNPSIDKGISNVEVSVLNLDTQITYTTRTNSGGLYTFSGLPAGSYRVFQFPTKELLLNAGETENANFAVIPAE